MEIIGKLRRMKLHEQLSNSEIAKRTGLSCYTTTSSTTVETTVVLGLRTFTLSAKTDCIYLG
jgi:hypothetical protein